MLSGSAEVWRLIPLHKKMNLEKIRKIVINQNNQLFEFLRDRI